MYHFEVKKECSLLALVSGAWGLHLNGRHFREPSCCLSLADVLLP